MFYYVLACLNGQGGTCINGMPGRIFILNKEG